MAVEMNGDGKLDSGKISAAPGALSVAMKSMNGHANMKPQTMRAWACLENGPIRPAHIHGRQALSVCKIRRLLSA